MITVEVESNVLELLDGFTEEVLLPAVIAAASEFAGQLEVNLQPHRSQQTGTGEQKSQDAKSEDTRTDLADSVIVIPESDEHTAEATVTVLAENAAKLAWLEYGHPQVFWGEDSGDLKEPTPVLRSAYQTKLADAENAFESRLYQGLNSG